jgi:hypothetical protein
MASRLTEIVVDCHDPAVLAAFWTAALDYHVVSTEGDQVEIAAWPTEPPDLAAQVHAGPGVPTLVFVPVPEGKSVKNRMHLDIRPVDRPYADELQRLVELGARRADIGQGDVPWVVLADPEGNEFCLLGPLDGDA